MSSIRNIKGTALRHVAILASGAAAGQAIAILSSPVLTRLFGTDAFGLFGTFSAITTSLGAVATLKYEQAIVLAPSTEAAQIVFRLCCLVALLSAALSSAAFLGVSAFAAGPFWQECFRLTYEFGGIAIFSLGLFNAANFWLTREQEFAVLGRYQIAKSLVTVSVQLLLSLVGRSGISLVLGQVSGQLLSGLLLLIYRGHFWRTTVIRGYDLTKMAAAARRYQAFPKFGAPQTIGRLLSVNIPALLLPLLYGPTQVGLFWLAYRMLILPSLILNESVRSVFFRRASEHHRAGGDLRSMVWKATFIMAVTSVPVVIVLALVGQDLFAFVFGADWRDAGYYAQILSVGWYFENCVLGSAAALSVREQQHKYLVLECLSVVLRASGLLGGYFMGGVVASLILFSAAAALSSLITIAYVQWFEHRTGDCPAHG